MNVAGGKRATPGEGDRQIPARRRSARKLAVNDDRGYRSLCSLNPGLYSLHRSAVPAARIRDRNYETTY